MIKIAQKNKADKEVLEEQTLRRVIRKLIQEKTDCYVHYADFDGDADKRDYVVSYDKINGLGYDTTISVDEGIDELLRVFPIVQMDNKKYKNG